MSNVRKNRGWIIGIAILSLVVIYILFFYQPSDRFNWREDYVNTIDRPFGTTLVTKMLKAYEPKRRFKELKLPLSESLHEGKTPSNYIFIGQDIYLQESYVDSLLSYVEKGNNAFLFTEGTPWLLLNAFLRDSSTDAIGNEELEVVDYYSLEDEITFDSLQEGTSVHELNELLGEDTSHYEEYYYNDENNGHGDEPGYIYGYDMFYTDSQMVRLYHVRHLKYTLATSAYRSRFGPRSYNWSYIPEVDINQIKRAERLGKCLEVNEDTTSYTNFIRVPYGDGFFYFHSQPILFTNIQVLNPQVFDYANGVFAYLNPGPVYWEEHNWFFNRPTTKTWTYTPGFRSNGESPLKLILSEPGLKWGWYMLLTFMVVFMIFEGKRKQRIIPVLEDKSNTTLEHLKSLSNLYYKKDDHYAIAEKMMESFRWYLRTNFFIEVSQKDEVWIKLVHIRTGYPEEKLEHIASLWKKIKQWNSVKSTVFLEFYTAINQFYTHLENES